MLQVKPGLRLNPFLQVENGELQTFSTSLFNKIERILKQVLKLFAAGPLHTSSILIHAFCSVIYLVAI